MANQTGSYHHPEQRKEARRKVEDRRQDIRFEPSKEGRRKNNGRRNGDGDVWDKHEE
tara:strand:- start:32346 stop:32516 length:171 start_codon:yes stop_codon:yes gene_type:complete